MLGFQFSVDIHPLCYGKYYIIFLKIFQYYAHQGKLKSIGRESDFYGLNLNSLKVAREIADKTGRLMAGNICNSTTFDPDDSDNVERTKNMFKASVWSVLS